MTANDCPKTFQPQTLEVLFDLLRAAAKTPGKIITSCVHNICIIMRVALF